MNLKHIFNEILVEQFYFTTHETARMFLIDVIKITRQLDEEPEIKTDLDFYLRVFTTIKETFLDSYMYCYKSNSKILANIIIRLLRGIREDVFKTLNPKDTNFMDYHIDISTIEEYRKLTLLIDELLEIK